MDCCWWQDCCFFFHWTPFASPSSKIILGGWGGVDCLS
jgi:hypothetical protein